MRLRRARTAARPCGEAPPPRESTFCWDSAICSSVSGTIWAASAIAGSLAITKSMKALTSGFWSAAPDGYMKIWRLSGSYEPSWMLSELGFWQLASSSPTPTRLSWSAFCS